MIAQETILTLELTLDGSPWCNINSSPNINVDTLEYTLNGSPWWGHSETAIKTGNVKRILKVDWQYVKTIINVE